MLFVFFLLLLFLLLLLLLLLLALVMHNKAQEHLDSKPFNHIKPKLQQAPMEARNILLLPLGCLNAWAVRLNMAESGIRDDMIPSDNWL